MDHWYALHTKPRKEHMVRQLLENRGLDTFLPVLTSAGKHPPAARREQPFFARYLFAHFDLSSVALSSLNWCQGMTSVVSFGGQPAVVQDEVIHWLKLRLAQIDSRDYHSGLPLVPDARLRVISGPLRGMEAIFDRRLSGQDWARVLVRLLGRLTAAEIPLSSLTLI